METIFDHSPTEDELIALFVSLDDAIDERQRMLEGNYSTDDLNIEIASLMRLRGNKPLFEKYLSRIQNPHERLTLWWRDIVD
jgi:hypothetical protein